MLINRLIIDGTDAYSEYGLYMKENALAALLAWPQFKKITTNDWHEEDGLEADLQSPVLDGRNVQLQFHLGHADSPSKARALISALKSTVYHTFAFKELGITYQLRYASNGAFSMNETFDTLTLTMAEDSVTKPVIGSTVTLNFANNVTRTFTIAVPAIPSVHLSGYLLDGIDMARFGAYVTKGTLDSFQKAGTVKENMKRNVSVVNGIIYDSTATPTTKPQDVTINMVIHASSVVDFWKKWYALFAKLMASGAHTLFGGGKRLSCYYKSCKPSIFYLLPDGGVWCEFSVTMAVLKDLNIQMLGTVINNTPYAIADNNHIVIAI